MAKLFAVMDHLLALSPATSIPGSHPKLDQVFGCLFVRFSGMNVTILVVFRIVLHFFVGRIFVSLLLRRFFLFPFQFWFVTELDLTMRDEKQAPTGKPIMIDKEQWVGSERRPMALHYQELLLDPEGLQLDLEFIGSCP